MNQHAQHIIPALPGQEPEKRIREILSSIPDPEIPVLTIRDLGIIRDIHLHDGLVEVLITPTYSGCPAMDRIAADIRKTLAENGFENIRIMHQLSPAWTTDWLTEEAREKLEEYGIAPPGARTSDSAYLKNLPVRCPHCHSFHTEIISDFGSTACKSLHQCRDCGEPFEHFKCH
jgi:ring-1,2-phenylacetyl-CoA epoxidase subunit PaaD